MPVNSFDPHTELPSENGESPQLDSAIAPLAIIQEALQGLRYGQVTVIVQDGVVVQVERTEKRRFKAKAPSTDRST